MKIFVFYKTRITVGYGDVLPVTNAEKILCILTMIVSCGVFGFVMNSVGVIFQELNKVEIEIDNKLYVINSFMNEKKVDPNL